MVGEKSTDKILHNTLTSCDHLLSMFYLILVIFSVQALDLHLWHGPRKLGCASGASHSLPGACPLDPLVRMLHPSSGTLI